MAVLWSSWLLPVMAGTCLRTVWPNGSNRCVADLGVKNLTISSGSGLDEQPFRFIAEKLPLKFRFLEAGIRH